MTETKMEGGGPDPRAILQRIADTWMIDPGKAYWQEDGPEGFHAFSWWPGDFCLKSRANPHEAYADPAVRIRIDTDFIRGIDVRSETLSPLLASMAHLYTSTYAWVFMPADVQDTFGDEAFKDHDPTRFWLSATAYIREETAGWLPEFFARMAILQPINAQIQAGELAQLLHAEPDTSPDPSDPQAPLDEILGVLGQVIIPIGKEPSRWEDCEEFVKFAETWGRSDICFGMGDPTGLTLETPFGNDSALIRFLTDQTHPQLGNGLLATLQLPVLGDKHEISKLTNELNYLEANMWTGFPLLGCWHSREIGENYAAAFSLFVPNALHQPMIATNVAFWMLNRAQWVKSSRFEHLENRPMIEILNRRLGVTNGAPVNT
ncbi:MAG: hypothetical protein KGQ75_14900 [Sphingomonadales bacterium]|nr:hypothetical protein [Sphingomonadales bacterium]